MQLTREQTFLVLGAFGLIAAPVLQVARDNAESLIWADFWTALVLISGGQFAIVAILALLLRRSLAIAATLTFAIWFAAHEAEFDRIFAEWGLISENGTIFSLILLVPLGLFLFSAIPNEFYSRVIGVGGVAIFLTAAAQFIFTLEPAQILGSRALRADPIDGDPIPPYVSVRATGRLPDIVYIVPDRYPSAGVLQRFYGHENKPFLEALRRRGFAVADDARANYLKTRYSLASSLNMQYLDGFLDSLDRKTRRPGPLYDLISQNLVSERLRAMGYQIVHFSNWWDGTRISHQADRIERHWPMSFAGEFGFAVLDRSLLVEMPLSYLIGASKCDATKRQFEAVKYVGGKEQPTFVFVHLLVPHPPVLTNGQGECIEQIEYPVKPYGVTWDQFRAGFSGYVDYFNKQILEIFDQYANENPNPVFFIVQSDEGPFPKELFESNLEAQRRKGRERVADFDWTEATEDQLAIKFGILNAIYMEGVDPSTVPLDLSPVNNWRLIFSQLEGKDYPLLPDKYYIFPSEKTPYQMIDVTERLDAIPR